MAFAELKRRVAVHGTTLSWAQIAPTFRVQDEELYLAGRARGIFKPNQMKRGALSIRTPVPREGRSRRYVDIKTEDSLYYSFQGEDPNSGDNQRLKETMEDQSPLIYFFGVSEGVYEAIFPVYISHWDPKMLRVEISIAAAPGGAVPSGRLKEDERKYRVREVQERIHQSAFRELVLNAYGGKCALSGLPVRTLLTAAHIYPDGHEKGLPEVSNGIALSALHHTAYDTKLIGISPDYRVEVSERLFSQTDGPLLEGLKALHGNIMRLPREPELRPSREALAFRFDEFMSAR